MDIINSVPIELKVLLAAGIVLIVLDLIKTIRRKTRRAKLMNPKTINPFALSTRLNGKTIRAIQRMYKNDR